MERLSQSDIIDMYSQQASPMAGGRRRRVPMRRAPVRRRRGMGLVGGADDLFASLEVPESLDGYTLGAGLVGGRRRRAPASRKMPASVKAYFAARKAAGAPRRRRGGALVGGKSNQEIYDELVDSGQPITPETVRLMMAGIQPATQKDVLIRQIRSWERKLGLGQTTAERLRKYTAAALQQILGIYKQNKETLAYPPLKDQADQWEDDRFDAPSYFDSPEQFEV